MKFISKEDALLGGLTLILQIIFIFFGDNFLVWICFFGFIVLNILNIMRLIKRISFLEQMNNRFYRLSAFLRPLGWFFYIEVGMFLFLIAFGCVTFFLNETSFIIEFFFEFWFIAFFTAFFIALLVGLIRMIFAKPPVPSADTEVKNTGGEILRRSGGR